LHPITISNPAPGGGGSASLPLHVYNAIKAGVNHILYDPFSRKIFATLGSAMASGNSIEALAPDTGTFTTPVPIGSEPTNMALSDDGHMLYVLATGSSRIVRCNMLTQRPESDFAVPSSFGSDSAKHLPKMLVALGVRGVRHISAL
jgi:trimeric autotransporter adhesin